MCICQLYKRVTAQLTFFSRGTSPENIKQERNKISDCMNMDINKGRARVRVFIGIGGKLRLWLQPSSELTCLHTLPTKLCDFALELYNVQGYM